MSNLRCAALAAALLLAAVPAVARGQGLTRVSGTVLDDGDRPIAGARIVLSSGGGSSLRGTTDRQGFFAVLGLAGGITRIVVEKSGFGSCAASLSLESADDVYATVQLASTTNGAACDVRAGRAEPFDRYVIH